MKDDDDITILAKGFKKKNYINIQGHIQFFFFP